jgi:AcrR family transcriptional regulator
MAARTEAGPPRSRARGERAEKRDRLRVVIGPDEQRARIMAKAQAVFSARGYARTTFVEVAEAVHVSEAQLRRHFPGGRPEFVLAVAQQQLEEMTRELRRAARVPFPARVRLRRLLKTLFDYVIDHPGTYRLLFGDAALAVDPALGPAAAATRVRLTDEVARILAGSAPTPQVTAASAGVVGFALANIGLCLAGGLVPEHAWRVTCEFCTSQLPWIELDERQ